MEQSTEYLESLLTNEVKKLDLLSSVLSRETCRRDNLLCGVIVTLEHSLGIPVSAPRKLADRAGEIASAHQGLKCSYSEPFFAAGGVWAMVVGFKTA